MIQLAKTQEIETQKKIMPIGYWHQGNQKNLYFFGLEHKLSERNPFSNKLHIMAKVIESNLPLEVVKLNGLEAEAIHLKEVVSGKYGLGFYTASDRSNILIDSVKII